MKLIELTGVINEKNNWIWELEGKLATINPSEDSCLSLEVKA